MQWLRVESRVGPEVKGGKEGRKERMARLVEGTARETEVMNADTAVAPWAFKA